MTIMKIIMARVFRASNISIIMRFQTVTGSSSLWRLRHGESGDTLVTSLLRVYSHHSNSRTFNLRNSPSISRHLQISLMTSVMLPIGPKTLPAFIHGPNGPRERAQKVCQNSLRTFAECSYLSRSDLALHGRSKIGKDCSHTLPRSKKRGRNSGRSHFLRF